MSNEDWRKQMRDDEKRAIMWFVLFGLSAIALLALSMAL